MNSIDFSKYPDAEARRPRASFTAVLRKACQRLDSSGVQTVTDKRWYADTPSTVDMTASALCVVGSYARGALTCGDLDLVLDVRSVTGGLPAWSRVQGAFIGAPAAVRVYHGIPEKNSSGVSFSDHAVLVWQPGMDWNAAIERIAANPRAERFVRKGDAVPLRVEQHGLNSDKVGALVDARDDGRLVWRFIPLSELASLPAPPASPTWELVARRYRERSAEKARMAPVVFALAAHLTEGRAVKDELWYVSDVSCLLIGDIHVFSERLWLGPDGFDLLKRAVVAFIPTLGTRGPNGAWVVERGPNHPVVQAFAKVALWVLADEDGRPQCTGCIANDEYGRPAHVESLEVFPTEQSARDWEQELFEMDSADGDDDLRRSVPMRLGGDALLKLLPSLDLIEMPGGSLPLSQAGEHYCRITREPAKQLQALELATELVALGGES